MFCIENVCRPSSLVIQTPAFPTIPNAFSQGCAQSPPTKTLGHHSSAQSMAKSILGTRVSGTIRKLLLSNIAGLARGADALGAKFARAHCQLYEFPADWDRYGKRAGFMRNEQMGHFADGLIAFWDGKSRGTKHMIDFMKSLGKPVHIVMY